jgi:hypothetical protein
LQHVLRLPFLAFCAPNAHALTLNAEATVRWNAAPSRKPRSGLTLRFPG